MHCLAWHILDEAPDDNDRSFIVSSRFCVKHMKSVILSPHCFCLSSSKKKCAKVVVWFQCLSAQLSVVIISHSLPDT